MLSNNLKQVHKSATLLINEQSKNLELQGKEIFKLGFGQSPFSPPKSIIEEVRKNANQHYYAPVQGIPELREAISEFHKNDFNASPDNIFIAPGSKILLYAVMCSYDHANILIPSPSWVSYAPQALLCGHDVIKLETSFEARWRVSPEQLDEALEKTKGSGKTNILILNYPGNPDGLTYSADELKELGEVLRKHQALVISDEIYGLVNHDGQHTSISKFYPEGTLITTGLSKWCGAGGWRLGALTIPEENNQELKETLLGVASETYSCNAVPIQLAAIQAYQHTDEIDNYIIHKRRALKLIGNYSHQILSDAGIDVHKPQGGFYLFPYINKFKEKMAARGLTDINKTCVALMGEAGVATLPSTAFGFNDDFYAFRLSYTDFDGNKALEESLKIPLDVDLTTDFAEQYMGKTVRGIRKMADWITSA